ncbi:MAG: hypothetical protein LBU32_18465 [Clostridiales bacterium]|nr:hypothetical protein [Clostridiales bacterium]
MPIDQDELSIRKNLLDHAPVPSSEVDDGGGLLEAPVLAPAMPRPASGP